MNILAPLKREARKVKVKTEPVTTQDEVVEMIVLGQPIKAKPAKGNAILELDTDKSPRL
jgi:hypothetical protein